MSNRMLTLRKELGLSQKEMADILGTTQATLSRHEKKNSVPYELLDVINEHFKINLNWLISGKGNMIEGNIIEADKYSYQNEINKYLKNNAKIDKINILNNIMASTYALNHLRLQENPNCIYFAAITQDEILNLVGIAKDYNTSINRNCLVVECKNKTLKQILTFILKSLNISVNNKDTNTLYEDVLNIIYNQDVVMIFEELSKANRSSIQHTFSSFIKAIDDAPVKKIYPRSDIIFIDYASFLEKHQDMLYPYLDTNIIK